MKLRYIFLAIASLYSVVAAAQINFSAVTWQEGFVDIHWDNSEGKLYARLNQLDTEVLYNTGLAAGVGSNDLGLDRGQLGGTHVVTFHRVGNKILLVEKNYAYRAESDNAMERQSVDEAFAQSILWGFELIESTGDEIIVDLTDFLLRDAHHISRRLTDRHEGNYAIDKSRSAIYLPRTKSFPKNTELEAITTFIGDPKGDLINTVTPSSEAVTVRQHHSFIELPDDQFSPRKFDARSGYYPISFHDYATAIHEPIRKQYISRHRLNKKKPNAEISEAVEPIIYYVDPGAPEPIRSALIEGAMWWNQAFEAAGYKNAFEVKILPTDADPMDVRYNLIQWVHRSTRGWSYGGSVTDPRTGEIIKGHVSLGSLRVRQDFLIAQGLLPAFGSGGPGNKPLEDLALARLRQLSAHEVGHTLGLAHNFAASTNDRASVMDYPHPLVSIVDGKADFSNVYDDKIGAWDKRTIMYGYMDFGTASEATSLEYILSENETMGLHYLSDEDARSVGSANPYAHLWDNGTDASIELKRIIDVRATAMAKFGEDNIRDGEPMARLEDVLVPLYLSHRYQVEATAKLIGGQHYTYAVKGPRSRVEPVSGAEQYAALEALLTTIDPAFLRISERILSIIPPRTMGDSRGRELFKNRTSPTFDPLGIAEAAAAHTISYLLNPQRLSRLVEQNARFGNIPSVEDLLKQVEQQVKLNMQYQGLDREVAQVVEYVFVNQLMHLAIDQSSHHQVRGAALRQLTTKKDLPITNSHRAAIHFEIENFLENPEDFKIPRIMDLPDGSPIGMIDTSDCSH